MSLTANAGSWLSRDERAFDGPKVSHPVRRLSIMVAIHLPRPVDEWVDDRPGDAPVIRRVDRRPVARRLPDRATRVRRRRLAALLAVVVVAAVGALVVQAIAGLATVDGTAAPREIGVRAQPVAGRSYVVQPGDTLWSIAVEIAPDRDPRAVVAELRAANGGPRLEVGDELTLDLG
jgi:LysM domain